MSYERIAVVTGANKGIGFAVVKNLASQFNGLVYLTSRNEELGKKAVAELVERGLLNIRYHQLDVADDESIKKFANYIQDTHGGLDILINNAGIAFARDDPSSFGLKAAETIKINFTGILHLCHALFPLLRPYARVANFASYLGQLNNIKNKEIVDKLSSENATEQDIIDVMNDYVRASYDGTYETLGYPTAIYSAYSVSKIGVIALTRVQQRAFDKDPRPGILVNSLCPGYVNTDMSSHYGTLTPDQGSETAIMLALLPENTEGPRGEFYYDKKPSDWFTQDILEMPDWPDFKPSNKNHTS